MPPVIAFPFWITTKRLAAVSLPVVPPDRPGYVVAFTTVEKAVAYAGKDGDQGCEFKMVSRATLTELAAALRALGVRGVCLDPCEEGGPLLDFEQIT
jgi:hypothetical protein